MSKHILYLLLLMRKDVDQNVIVSMLIYTTQFMLTATIPGLSSEMRHTNPSGYTSTLHTSLLYTEYTK